MKHSACYIIAILLTMIACRDQSLDKSQPKGLSLVAPNGSPLASSMESLATVAQQVMMQKTGRHSPCRIESIQYYPVKKGFMSLVSFNSSDGFRNSFLRGDAQVSFSTEVIVLERKKNSSARMLGYDDDGSGGTSTITCSGGSCCTPTYNITTHEAACKCEDGNNSSCKLSVSN